MPEFLTTEEAAEELNLSVNRVRQLCRDGRLGEKVGRDWVITRAELDAFRDQDRPPGRPRQGE